VRIKETMRLCVGVACCLSTGARIVIMAIVIVRIARPFY
jgi:hypothetical protein